MGEKQTGVSKKCRLVLAVLSAAHNPLGSDRPGSQREKPGV